MIIHDIRNSIEFSCKNPIQGSFIDLTLWVFNYNIKSKV